ncbi:MAG TPA: serine/threonine-protein kinase [Verrucomicrobiae bacterium]|jgi:serine/threonine protein kinase|nr:serine/threonine-protein kinase [Verrucomicrobiae bacterium]
MDTSVHCPSCGKPLAPDAPQGLCQECLLKAGFPTGTDSGGKSSRFVAPSIEELTAKFPQLEILSFIGQGGMGAVYQARQKQLNRFVALKILPPDVATEPAFAERFTREAQALAQLSHPGIVTLYEFGQADGLFYFLMEFVDGVTLRQLLRNGRISPREALAIVPQICDALQFAHDQGIVHRDIKPENVLLDRRGRVKVADFGLAKLVGTSDEPASGPPVSHASTSVTDSGKIMGTPSYMAPEQVDHPADVDHRADIYALGVVFYQMLTGELPAKKIEPPSKKVHIDVRLDEVVLRALEKEPERRYQHAGDVKTRVETIAASEGGSTSLPTSRGQQIATLLFNPFVRLTGPQSLLIGLAMILIAGFIGSLSRTHFDGVLDTHTGMPAPLWFFLSQGIVNWLSLALVLLIFGKLAAKKTFNALDLFSGQALARWPAFIIAFCFLPPAVRRFGDYFLEQFRLGLSPRFNSVDAIIFITVTAAMIPLICWMVWLMYQAYRVSSKMPTGRAVITFIPALILAEILSKVVIHQIFKLI